ncbi:MAG: hypothetical protein ACQERN_00430 [Thermodesulfobacteriota bacterium]
MITRWLPWKFFIKRAAKRYGIIDPIKLAAQVRRFAQPSEVQEPIELLRAGIIFHARGLINTKAIQYNLDWVWPYWVEKQFDPHDNSFIPRAFSFSHVNLTHRNWTAVGHPDLPVYPIVDPRGLVTPLFDGWSIDCWLITDDGRMLLPSRSQSADQQLLIDSGWQVQTRFAENGFELTTRLALDCTGGGSHAVVTAEGRVPSAGWLVAAIRPYNPEGIQFVENIEYQYNKNPFLLVNRHTKLFMDQEPDKILFSDYSEGDVNAKWDTPHTVHKVHCGVGMATSAAFFKLDNRPRQFRLSVNTGVELPSRIVRRHRTVHEWSERLVGAAQLAVPDSHIRFLYDAAVRTLLMLSADDIVPGPYTYQRFWFRDACLMLNALMAINHLKRARRCINSFPARQQISGYFRSQEGEWDSNGQVLWIVSRYLDLTGETPVKSWLDAVFKGADWIQKKRITKRPGLRHGGLLPAGFSAEHLGPNDYYYWDDFWGLAGLQSAEILARQYHSTSLADTLAAGRDDFYHSIFESIAAIPEKKKNGCIPASPYRRMDAGAVGSLVADYPLQLTAPGDSRILNSIDFLMTHCFFKGAFFQDMIHSGINVYLTLDIAQSLLRAGDPRYRPLIETVANLASCTGQWPEAIHPLTGGGCMGDGQHGWAAAEWIMMMRNLFVREEANRLIIGSGVFEQWLTAKQPIGFGPTPTPYGEISVTIESMQTGSIRVVLDTAWRYAPPEIEIRIPGFAGKTVSDTDQKQLQVEVQKI